jgi:transglutaminase-like putative cysteine protease
MSRAVRPLLPYAEAALVVLSLSVVLSFNRLFDDGSFFPRLAAFALVAHGVSIITRRAGWSVAAGGAVSLVALALTIGIVLYPSTTVLGIPTGDTLSIVRADLASVWNDFQSVTAPTPVTTPFLLAAGLALWWSAFVADWAAFRVWVPFESVVPAGTVFVFASLFAASQSRVPLTAVFILAAMAFLLIHRVTRQQSNTGWVSTDVQRGTNALLRAGAGLTVAAVVLAIVVGPNLPQAESAGLVSWRGNDSGGGPRTTVSPLVDIQAKLVQQSNVELFTVQSDQRAYWRLTALDEFDGQIWKSDGSYGSADGSLPKSVDSSASKNLVRQHYRIGNLNSIWLPAAYEPRAVDNTSGDVRYEPATATLIVGNNAPTSNSAAYDIQSEFPVFDRAQLEAANEAVPDAITQKDLQLPSDFSPTAETLAREIVANANASTVYDQAIALQNYFRDNFTYDLNVEKGHDESAIERFLAIKRGYCEQFAGTYAAMARSLGLPARVAVGFTPGQQDGQDKTVYHVLGLNAHAWPEVYIGGQGWVLFEPTPTRGAPFAEQYTGVVEEQADTATSTVTVPTTAPQSTPTTAGPNTPTTRPKEDVEAGGSSTTTQEPAFWSTNRFGGKALLTGGLLVVLGVLYAIGIAVFWAVHRSRRRAAAVDPDDRVRLAWQESIEALSLIGLTPTRAETPAEFGARAASTAGLDGFADLARLMIRSSYGPSGATDEDAERAFALSEQVSDAAKSQASVGTRVRSVLDPRPFDKRRPVKRSGPTRVHLDAPVIEILRFD